MQQRMAVSAGGFLAVAVLAGNPAAQAAGTADNPYPPAPPLHLYEARTVVTGTDMRSRPAGMATCLADVLVQVSGDPGLLADPRATALGRDAARLVASFDYFDRMSGLKHNDEQGSSDRPYYLTVRFDPARIDAALQALGDAPYAGKRPTLLPVVFVQGVRAAFVMTGDGAHLTGQPQSFTEAGDRYFVRVHIPSVADLTHGMPPSGPDTLPVVGTLAWSDAAHGWIAAWAVRWRGRGVHWGVAGASFDEAFRLAVRGALGVVARHPPKDSPAPAP